MRLSAIQKDVLFVLYALHLKGVTQCVDGPRLMAMVNKCRASELHASNFRASCHTLNAHGALLKFRSSSLGLAWQLSDLGVEKAKVIYEQRCK